jgi:antitoxin (DNA-binding transcriptional repressor) of toxin-antitoxin stability system
MKFLSVRELKSKSAQVWRDLPTQKEMIVTSNGRPIAMLSSINEKNLEMVLKSFRIARATNAVASLQYSSTEKGIDQMSTEEIDAEIQIVRDERK